MLSGRHLFRSLVRCNQRSHPTWRTPMSALVRSLCDSKTDKLKNYTDSTHNTPKYQLQPIDKFFIVATGTMKRGEIPNEVSYEIVEKSQNRRRIMVNLFTIFLTICGCTYAINRGKNARDHHTEDTVFERNVKRYEKLREEDARKEAAKTNVEA